MGTHPIFESDFDCLTEMDFEVVKTEAQEFDRWVTGLVDLIPTQVYVSFLKNIYGFHFCLDIQRYVTNKN